MDWERVLYYSAVAAFVVVWGWVASASVEHRPSRLRRWWRRRKVTPLYPSLDPAPGQGRLIELEPRRRKAVGR